MKNKYIKKNICLFLIASMFLGSPATAYAEESTVDIDAAIEETISEDVSLEETSVEEVVMDESSLEDQSLEESSLVEQSLEEPSQDEIAQVSDEWAYAYRSSNYLLGTKSVVLFPGEKFKLHPGNVGSLVYSSADDTIATVSADGEIEAIKIGSTTISATSEEYGTVTCAVNVVADDGYYMKNLAPSDCYNVTEEKTSKEYDKFILKTDAGLYIEPEFGELIGQIFDEIENVNGYKTYADPSNIPSARKVAVEVFNANVEPSASSSSLTLDSLCAYPTDLSVELYCVVHELSHTLAARHFGSNAGPLFAEGLSEATTDAVLDRLPGRWKGAYDTLRMYTYGFYDSSFAPRALTKDNAEELLIHSGDMHSPSFWICKYVIDTYGRDKLDSIISKSIEEKSNSYDKVDLQYELLKNETSEDILDKIVDYYNAIDKSYTYDATDFDSITARIGSFNFFERFGLETHNNASYYPIKYVDSLTIDCLPVYGYCEKVLGKKFSGTVCTITGESKVSFYDRDGKLLRVEFQTDDNKSHTYKVKNATSFKLENEGETEVKIVLKDSYSTTTVYDQEYELKYTYDKPSFSWSEDNTKCTGTAKCFEDESKNITETVDVKKESVTLPSCTSNGTDIYSATFTESALFVKGSGTISKSVTIPRLGHVYDSETLECERCHRIKPVIVISPIEAQEYTGQAIKPIVNVKFAGNTLKLGTDYTVTYKNNTKAYDCNA